MRRALALAARGVGHVAPNPQVGAVLVRDGFTVGEGWHAQFGGPHAEIMALQSAGSAAQGATLYVTLEPCHHHGKTPPCTAAIVHAGISRVVYAVEDPHGEASGGGAYLRDHGLQVTRDIEAERAREQNAVFLFAQRVTTRPFVTVKLGISIDGAIVDQSRTRAWITGSESRQAVHQLRTACDAIAVGIETVLADNPSLTVREALAPRVAPRRIVFDRQARLPLASVLAQTAHDVPVIVVVAHDADASRPSRLRALEALGVQLLFANSLIDALAQLREQGVEHLLLEGGATLVSAFLTAEMVDRVITFQAPVVLGEGALSAFGSLPARSVDHAPRWRVVERREFGPDLMTIYAVSDAVLHTETGD